MDPSLVDIEWADGEGGGLRNSVLEAVFSDVFFDVFFEWRGTPVWFHGDIGGNNLLVTDGRLSAVIDFGTSGIGDPACDLVIAWTMLREESREAFRHTVGHDDGTWARARGWALWKSLLTLTQCSDPRDERVAIHLDVIDAVLADHERFA
ncbi:phosphotransferase [Streptomyces sp. NPDC058357]|uniref:phosphotransferase n=1 Tax=unclassified Streptomyces TaxID=2593676 RepID=UPI00365E3786